MTKAPSLTNPEDKAFEQFYRQSLFWIKVRPVARKAGIVCLLVFGLLTGSIALYRYLDFVANDFFSDRALIGAIAQGNNDLHQISLAHSAVALKASVATVLVIDDSRVDFFAELTNPNLDWRVSFTYVFRYPGGETRPQKGFLLPGEVDKPFVALAQSLETLPKSATLQISDLSFARLNHQAIPDYPSFSADRLKFEVSDLSFERDVDTSITIGRSAFTIDNKTAFSYWNPTFAIVLYRNNQVVAVNMVSIPELRSLETREVTVNWFGEVPQANATKIIPLIDIFDPSVYMPLEGQLIPDLRERVRPRR